MTPSFQPYLADLRREVETALGRVMTGVPTPPVLAGPMRYALTGPGKRLRPCLTLAVADAVAARVGLPMATARLLVLPGACAVEMIHTYSLVHDDLPAMDNDDLRRGRPTTHVVHGDGLAILAGDGLLTDAFTVLAAAPSPAVPADAPVAPAEHRLRAAATLALAAGSPGMVGGQAIDLASVGRVGAGGEALGPDALRDMHARKTGALIRAASTLGAILVGAEEATIEAIDRYAAELGLAFQIVDDVLDVEGSSASLGKTAGKDAAAGKPTFPALYGLDASKGLAADCVARARQALGAVGIDGHLGALAEWTLHRTS